MFIGEVAKKTGSTPRAIRLYESLGLLHVNRHGKYRVYTQQDVEFIVIIKEAQALGIKLAELQSLKTRQADLDWVAVLSVLDSKRTEALADIRERQRYLEKVQQCKEEILACIKALDSAP
ncbi:MerR family transcriptional regulator [Vibrio coralliilyticus]|uniref:MerR family transcriptional regulator n=1 Tax=Vibrio coralliilyticus TaxID=190893 RepID=UPI0015604FEE|nr:MerR family transcriptional regulator [Vibrio coralliilyticus]NRF32214.1 MerR family transcriptional regulator [Vibrio coralliilyticus]NRF53291.1 MerR family transcriptional regulator [Vibrio coralliilyticus]NRG03469.1 MerR family transcriptional regulator [Vibrio coralliilyticus]